jgi:hypothetical protein
MPKQSLYLLRNMDTNFKRLMRLRKRLLHSCNRATNTISLLIMMNNSNQYQMDANIFKKISRVSKLCDICKKTRQGALLRLIFAMRSINSRAFNLHLIDPLPVRRNLRRGSPHVKPNFDPSSNNRRNSRAAVPIYDVQKGSKDTVEMLMSTTNFMATRAVLQFLCYLYRFYDESRINIIE